MKFNERIISAGGSLLFGLFILFVYLFKHAVPLTDIYLGNDRTTHVRVVFYAGILGLICLILIKRLKKFKWLRFAGFGFSSFLMLVLPLLIFFRQSGSFRGTEWALETLIIGIVPLLFVYAAVLVFSGNRIVNLFLALVFSAFSVYHLLLLFKMVRTVGRAFSSTGTSDILIMVLMIVSGAIFAIFSMKQFLNFRK